MCFCNYATPPDPSRVCAVNIVPAMQPHTHFISRISETATDSGETVIVFCVHKKPWVFSRSLTSTGCPNEYF